MFPRVNFYSYHYLLQLVLESSNTNETIVCVYNLNSLVHETRTSESNRIPASTDLGLKIDSSFTRFSIRCKCCLSFYCHCCRNKSIGWSLYAHEHLNGARFLFVQDRALEIVTKIHRNIHFTFRNNVESDHEDIQYTIDIQNDCIWPLGMVSSLPRPVFSGVRCSTQGFHDVYVFQLRKYNTPPKFMLSKCVHRPYNRTAYDAQL